ncbi:hypothetical protein TRFO_30238 [Tritrichomonas foetus]|uniref:Uncharacterized protein n=1 Tax=Tritrichomonas foetus TaxID=1144522 RepID=A0A1J4JYJ8_9EUKA|nr:hypothetical protein TRFO_30238 [Tritrichomonas foetus]|eukprot:OHT02574.1 hypothetical protein TRFO_30238 [Tritrichomonas foetus]
MNQEMTESLKLNIKWPVGTMLPVRVEPFYTPRDLANMLNFASKPNAEMIFIESNSHSVLNHDVSFKDQKINPDAIILVQYRPIHNFDNSQLFVNNDSNLNTNLADQVRKSVQGLYVESLRLRDLRMNSALSYSLPSREQVEEYNDAIAPINIFAEFIDETQIPEKSFSVSTKPLPILWCSYHSDDDEFNDEDKETQDSFFDQFSSVEDARHYFSKEMPTDWIW